MPSGGSKVLRNRTIKIQREHRSHRRSTRPSFYRPLHTVHRFGIYKCRVFYRSSTFGKK
jgi:hypothetical protein